MTSTRPKNPNASLAAIPPELFEHVAELVDEKDLPALRLVCRDAAAKTHRIFVRVHFTHKAFMPSVKESLEAALEIAEHPAFGSALRKITFYADVPPTKVEGLAIRREHRHRREELRYVRSTLAQESQELRKSKQDISLLAALFKALNTPGKITELVIATEPHEGNQLKPILGETQITRFPYEDIFVSPDGAVPSGAVPSLMSVLFKAITTSTVDHIQTISMRPSTSLCVHNINRGDYTTWCLGLQSMRSISLRPVAKIYYIYPHTRFDLATALSNAHALETLKLDLRASLDLVMPAFVDLTFSKLKTLEIAGGPIDLLPFVEFVKRQPGLEYLDVENCSFKGDQGLVKAGESYQECLGRLMDADLVEKSEDIQ